MTILYHLRLPVLAAIFFSFLLKTNAQAPGAIPYQAVARNSSGNLLQNQSVSLRFNIRDGGPLGTVLYQETHGVTTNALGLFSVNIGQGIPVSGTFGAIDWGGGTKFTQVELDPAGGTAYVDMGTVQMLSVPYALYAATSGSAVTETDPQVGSSTTNSIPKWNGTTLTDSLLYDNGANVGIGTTSPAYPLHIKGTADRLLHLQGSSLAGTWINLQNTSSGGKTWNLISTGQLDSEGAGNLVVGINLEPRMIFHEQDEAAELMGHLRMNDNNLYLRAGSDDTNHGLGFFGNDAPNGLWNDYDVNGPVLWGNAGGVLGAYHQGTQVNALTWKLSGNVGIGTSAPSEKLEVAGTTKTVGFQMPTGAASGHVLQSDASGNGSWAAPSALFTDTDDQTLSLNGPTLSIDNGNSVDLSGLADNLGNHTATQNLQTNGNWLGNDGDDEGIFIKSDGKVGIATNNPATELHVKDGDTPTLRMEQSGGAFTPYTWDIGANEANFFVRDLTFGGDKLPFRIYPGSSSNRIVINGNNVGIGTNSPAALLDVNGLAKTTNFQMTNGATSGYVLQSDANGNGTWVNPSTFSATETDPEVGSSVTNYIPKWNGTTLTDGLLYDNGTNIGVGTTSPENKLHVVSSDATPVQIESSSEDGIGLKFYSSFTEEDFELKKLGYFGANGGNIHLNNNGATALAVTTSNKVGIGTTSPSTRLHVSGGNDIERVLRMSGEKSVGTWLDLENTSTGGTIYSLISTGSGNSEGAGKLLFRNSSSTLMTLNGASGNLGIGTASPAQKLDVVGTVKTVGFQMPTGAITGYVLQSDAGGNASWVAPTSLGVTGDNLGNHTATQTLNLNDHLLSGNVSNYGLRLFDGLKFTQPGSFMSIDFGDNTNDFVELAFKTTDCSWLLNAGADKFQLVDAVNNNSPIVVEKASGSNRVYIKGSNVGIGHNNPTELLDVDGKTKTINFQMTNGATSGYVLQSDASGNGSWVSASSIETDPQVSSGTTSRVPRWTGTTLSDGTIFDNGTNVGIGTTSPGQKLDVMGTTKTTNFQMTNGAANGYVLQSDGSGNASWVTPTGLITETDPQVSSSTINYIPKWNGTTLVDGLLYDNGTNAGIGTNSPANKLDVEGGIAIGSSYSGTSTAPSNGAIIEGNVGIGTSSPQAKLAVNGAVIIDQNGTNTGSLATGALFFGGLGGEAIASCRTNAINQFGLDFYTYSTKRMSIDLYGRVGIGTANPYQAKLVVDGSESIYFTNGYGFLNRNGAGDSDNTDNHDYSIFASDRIAASEFNAFSDARIKRVRGRSDNAADLKTLMQLKITDYTLIDTVAKGTKPHKKVIAQEVEQAYPQAVSTMTDVVPDIYKMASMENGFVCLDNPMVNVGERVKLIFGDKQEIAAVTAVSEKGFQTNLAAETGQVFVFGREVSDFRTVDYEAISMLNVSATQALVKQVTELQQQKTALENRLSRQEGKLNKLQEQMTALEAFVKGKPGN